jgi:hypothetical protein
MPAMKRQEQSTRCFDFTAGFRTPSRRHSPDRKTGSSGTLDPGCSTPGRKLIFSDSLGMLCVIFAEIRLAVKVEAVNGV